MLKERDTYATIPVSDMAKARVFFGETLGLSIARDTEGGVMYRSGSTLFFVYPSRFKAGGHTQMSWFVNDIKAEVAHLKAKGIKFEEYSVPGLTQVDGIMQSGPGVQTAWFKDPDGNMLGLTQID
jgi:catechol 2,3-dioxygenase-like lactoylglutathione lyase family enzyme